MVRSVTASEARTRFFQLLDEVAVGDEVDITKRGRIVARMVPARAPRALRGALREVARTATDDEEELFTTNA